MPTSDGNTTEWTWELFDRAQRQFDRLDPDDYIEPLTGAPHGKLRVGQFRLGVETDHTAMVLNVYTIEKREGAYRPGDD